MCASEQQAPVLQAIEVSNSYNLSRQHLLGRRPQRRVLNGVDLAIAEGEVFGLVGESGCGKTTLGKALLGLIEHQGRVLIDGRAFGRGARLERARRIQAVFQNPASALNPAKRVGWLLEEPLRIHGWARAKRRERVLEVLEQVGLDPTLLSRRVNELSGGQKQRVCIGCALVLSPRVIIADEPTSALDVSVAAQILNLFGDLHRSFGLSMLFISHNLEVVYYLCDRIAVMFEGRIVEQSTAQQLYDTPLHPYTRALLAAIPSIHERDDDEGGSDAKVEAAPASLAGCPYAPRCPLQTDICWEQPPELIDRAPTGAPPHLVRCHQAGPFLSFPRPARESLAAQAAIFTPRACAARDT